MTWPDLRFSHGRLAWNFLSWDWVLAGIIPFWIMLFILPGLHGLPLQFHNKVFKFNSMWRWNKRIVFQIFSIQKITDMPFIEPPFVFVYNLWQYSIKKTGKAWNKKYESPTFVFVSKAYKVWFPFTANSMTTTQKTKELCAWAVILSTESLCYGSKLAKHEIKTMSHHSKHHFHSIHLFEGHCSEWFYQIIRMGVAGHVRGNRTETNE